MQMARQFLAEGSEMAAKLEAILQGRATTHQHLRAVETLPYIGWDVIDAIMHLLDESKHALPREEIISTVLARGVFLGKGVDAKGEPEVQIGKSLKYHLMTRAEKQETYKKRKIKAVDPRLREINGLIGRAEWPDEKFFKISTSAQRTD
ncbi:MAG TPA: hypothetical protein VGN44_05695 [Candidatus Angelobacter sp.]|jgi:hypothetical protein